MARYIRTCSSSLQMRISVALVCMNESPPEDGKLCFCHRDKCNAADASIHRHRLSRTIAVVLLALLVPTLLLHCDNHALIAILNDDDNDDDMVRDTAFSDHKKTVSTTSCSNTRQRTSNDKIHRDEYVTSKGRSPHRRTDSATSNSNITHQYQIESITAQSALIRQATDMKVNTTATGPVWLYDRYCCSVTVRYKSCTCFNLTKNVVNLANFQRKNIVGSRLQSIL